VIIYKIENKNNGKIYIGLTTKSINWRTTGHLTEQTYIGKVLRKYGLQSFDISTIDSAEDKIILGDKEKYWIGFYNSHGPNGYNLTDGGEGGSGYKHTEEVKQNMRGPRSEEVKQNMRNAQNRPEVIEKKRNALLGKTKSEEFKLNLREICNLPEWKANQSKIQKIVQNQPEARKRNSEAQKVAQNRPEVIEKKRKPHGPMSEEGIKNVREAHNRPEVLAKMRKPRTEEQKQNNRNAQNRPEVIEKKREKLLGKPWSVKQRAADDLRKLNKRANIH
jgi:group I intron endonuclease